MALEHTSGQMTIEKYEQKVENQAKLIKGLTSENEELFHQYNHLMIRNQKMLKRVDDLQRIIDDLHIRIEELQLINGNMMQINDKLRKKDSILSTDPSKSLLNSTNGSASGSVDLDLDELFERWRNYPGQVAQNAPNLKKQVLMLANLYSTSALRAADLFNLAGVGGVTGARYVAALKKFGLIRYTGARKKGQYEITRAGIDFVENTFVRTPSDPVTGGPVDNQVSIMPEGIPLRDNVKVNDFLDHQDL